MKRNKEAVLKVLAAVEAESNVGGMSGFDLSTFCVEDCDNDELESAKLLLLDSGYLVDDGKIRITWAGHSLLEELRG
ncbi:hypothetical protein CYD26_22150 [Pseudomonas sp. FFUP_PS_473]|uniref:hypothetical protein n=1 Tax=unclassified Pseudomonas TaxID=196821 RepID=UPI000C7D6B7D|nr:hypothetical protein [Pseudomonas sp. FFUP_PS_473]MEE3633721.1 hypothetical protein [Pseudomonas sp. AL 58]PLP87085.1 hypothetical protein CYD26_22150 [Pseudomonas sp. FFUP_PS_473]